MALPDRTLRLECANLYLVTGLRPGGRPVGDVVRAAVRGGVGIVQLRAKQATDDEIRTAAADVLAACDAAGATFILNDRPDLAVEVGAHGVHVGQDDLDPVSVRTIVGDDLLVGLSTHTPEQVDRAAHQPVDYIGVGPVHATPTKPGRDAVGLELVRHAASADRLPWYAIGGIDERNVATVAGAGAARIAVVRAIAEAADPRAAATALSSFVPLTAEAARG